MKIRKSVRPIFRYVYEKICANFQLNPKKAQEIFWILKIKVFRNNNFHASQVVKENYVVCTLTFLQYNIWMLSISVKNKNEFGVYIKKKQNEKNSSDILRLYW